MQNNGIIISGGNVTATNITVNNNDTFQTNLTHELNKLYEALDNDKDIPRQTVEDAKKQLNEASSEKNKNKFLAVLKSLKEVTGASSAIINNIEHIKEAILRLF